MDGSGRPIADAQIQVQAERDVRDWTTTASGESSADGEYRLGPLPRLPSSVRIRVSSAGFASVSRKTFPGARNTFRLEPGGGVRGVVRWERSGLPVSGFELEISGHDGSERAATDESGEYAFPGLAPGEYHLASCPRRVPSVDGVVVDVSAGQIARRDIWVSQGTTVHGQVAGAGGKRLAGAVVRCGNLLARTNADGEYRLDGVPPCGTEANPRDMCIEVNFPGHSTFRQALVLASGVREFRLDVALSSRDAESGARPTISLVHDGERLANVAWFDRAGAVFRSPVNAVGGTDCLELPLVTPRAVFGRTPDGWIGRGEAPPRDAMREAPLLVEALRVGVMRGRVRTESGEPVTAASVQVRTQGPWGPGLAEWSLFDISTDDLGRFEVAVPPGVIALEYRRGKGDWLVKKVDDPVGGREHEMELVVRDGTEASGERVGQVVDEACVPIEGAKVTSWTESTHTDSRGAFRIESTDSGIVVSHPLFAPESRFHVEAADRPLVVVLRRGYGIRGRLDLGDDPAPVRQFRIWLEGVSDQQMDGTWVHFNDRDGRFLVSGLSDREYRLRVVAEGRASRLLDRVKALPLDGADEFVVRLEERVAITGVVRAGDGEPVPYAIIDGARLDADGDYPALDAVAMSDSHGRFRWPVMYEGKYALRTRVSRANASAVVSRVDVRGGRDTCIELLRQE